MFIAHVPAGYLLTRSALRSHATSRWLVALGLFASIAPDLDLLRNFLIDGRRVHHHRYWTHLPAWWLVITLAAIALMWLTKSERLRTTAIVFLPNVWLHLLLDTWAGHIAWAWPLDDRFFAVVEVPRRYAWYVWSFLLHWSFLLELAIVAIAAGYFWSCGLNSGGGAAPPSPKRYFSHCSKSIF